MARRFVLRGNVLNFMAYLSNDSPPPPPEAQQPNSGLGRLIVEISRSHTLHTHAHTSEDSSDHPRGHYLHNTTQHNTTNTRDEHPCFHRDSDPRYRQCTGRTPTFYIARSPGSASFMIRHYKFDAFKLDPTVSVSGFPYKAL